MTAGLPSHGERQRARAVHGTPCGVPRSRPIDAVTSEPAQPMNHLPIASCHGAPTGRLSRVAAVALALTLGILFGVYSSVFVAAALAKYFGVQRSDLVRPVKEERPLTP